jgi:hypothetical protein
MPVLEIIPPSAVVLCRRELPGVVQRGTVHQLSFHHMQVEAPRQVYFEAIQAHFLGPHTE